MAHIRGGKSRGVKSSFSMEVKCASESRGTTLTQHEVKRANKRRGAKESLWKTTGKLLLAYSYCLITVDSC